MVYFIYLSIYRSIYIYIYINLFFNYYFLLQKFEWDLGGQALSVEENLIVHVKDWERIGRNRSDDSIL